MTFDWRHWALTHVIWIAAVGVGGVGIHSWITEHDNRLLADKAVAVDEQKVKTLNDQIATSTATIAGLQQQIDDNDARARQQIAQLQNLVAKVKTAPQAASAIGDMTQGAVTPKAETNGDLTIPAPQVIPLFEELAAGKQSAISFQSCSEDLATEKQMLAETQKNFIAEQNIVVAKQNEIDSIKKPKKFWRRFGSELKTVGISVGIGWLVGHKF